MSGIHIVDVYHKILPLSEPHTSSMTMTGRWKPKEQIAQRLIETKGKSERSRCLHVPNN